MVHVLDQIGIILLKALKKGQRAVKNIWKKKDQQECWSFSLNRPTKKYLRMFF
jgi:hypothetical protein